MQPPRIKDPKKRKQRKPKASFEELLQRNVVMVGTAIQERPWSADTAMAAVLAASGEAPPKRASRFDQAPPAGGGSPTGLPEADGAARPLRRCGAPPPRPRASGPRSASLRAKTVTTTRTRMRRRLSATSAS